MLRHPSHRTFHRDPLTEAQEASDVTRFYRWHIDAALFKLHPPKVTTLLALEVPKNRDQTVVYDDGSGDTLSVSLGATAFISGYRAFRELSPEQKDFALRTVVRYAPHPYVWIRNARAMSDGLGLVSEGKELARADLPPFTGGAGDAAARLAQPAHPATGAAGARLLRRGSHYGRQARGRSRRMPPRPSRADAAGDRAAEGVRTRLASRGSSDLQQPRPLAHSRGRPSPERPTRVPPVQPGLERAPTRPMAGLRRERV